MSKTWFTADTHFGHSNIITHCSRPFASVDEMDRCLTANWNAVVQPDDDVYVVGDFAFRGVGVDCWSYRPVNLAEIQERLATLPERGSRLVSEVAAD